MTHWARASAATILTWSSWNIPAEVLKGSNAFCWKEAKNCQSQMVGRVTMFSKYCINSLRPSDAYICVSNLTIIGSDYGLSPDRRQAIIWTNAGILLIGPLGTNFREILIEILKVWFKKMRLKVSSAKWRPFCLGLNVLTHRGPVTQYCGGSILCKNPIFFTMKEFLQI